MNIEEIIISIIGGSYIKNDSKGKFVLVIKKREIRIGSHMVIPLEELTLIKKNDKQQYVFNKKFFIERGDIDDFEFKIFIAEWKKNMDLKRRKAKFEDEPRAETILSLHFVGKLRNDFIKWYKSRSAYLKKVETLLNGD